MRTGNGRDLKVPHDRETERQPTKQDRTGADVQATVIDPVLSYTMIRQ